MDFGFADVCRELPLLFKTYISCAKEAAVMVFSLSNGHDAKQHFRNDMSLCTFADFIDLFRNFDGVPRDGLFNALKKLRCPPKMKILTMKFLSDLIGQVKVTVTLSRLCY